MLGSGYIATMLHINSGVNSPFANHAASYQAEGLQSDRTRSTNHPLLPSLERIQDLRQRLEEEETASKGVRRLPPVL